jgi:dTDP-4-amino-4,6-dideoxygalactose transaminase
LVVEDCAQAIGAEWKGERVGSLGDLACFSFQQSKLMTSGQGGMITTNDEILAEKCAALRNHGRAATGGPSQHKLLGSNCALTEFQSAVLLAQLSRLEAQTNTRMKNVAILEEMLSDMDGIEILPPQKEATRQAYYGYHSRFRAGDFGIPRDTFIEAMCAEGIPTGAAYSVACRDPLFQVNLSACPFSCNNYRKQIDYERQTFPVAELAGREIVSIPHRLLLGDEEGMECIIKAIMKIKNHQGELADYEAEKRNDEQT